METYTIPRGIKTKEIVAYGLSSKQIIYLGFGIGAGLSFFTLSIPIDLKIAGSVISAITSLMLSLAKRHGQELDKYIGNFILYNIRQKEWENSVEKESSIRINFHPRQSSAV
ncbi:MAG TPA: PrgI family protein [Geobacterales bacterium]|nr:PrgI family protein [Geobacterales bacterium]